MRRESYRGLERRLASQNSRFARYTQFRYAVERAEYLERGGHSSVSLNSLAVTVSVLGYLLTYLDHTPPESIERVERAAGVTADRLTRDLIPVTLRAIARKLHDMTQAGIDTQRAVTLDPYLARVRKALAGHSERRRLSEIPMSHALSA